MNDNITQDTHDRLASLIQARDYDGAQALLKDRFAQLPAEVQGRLLVLLLADAIAVESRALDTALAVQQEGITALKALEEMRSALQR